MEFIQNEAKSSRQGFKNKAVAKKICRRYTLFFSDQEIIPKIPQ